MRKLSLPKFSFSGRILSFCRLLPLVFLSVVLAGCQTEVYSQLDERQLNEMAIVLESNGISVSRQRDSEGTYTLLTDGGDAAAAISILSRNGLPRENFEGMGDVFTGDKLVSTAFEEKARFVYAMEQQLADSLTRIAGVSGARVHISLPAKQPLEETPQPSRAAVFIYHAPNADLNSDISVIKNLVVQSVESLNYEDVVVALFPADIASAATRAGGPSFDISSLFIPMILIGLALWFLFGKLLPRPAQMERIEQGKSS